MGIFSTLSNAQRPGHGGSSSPLIGLTHTTYWHLTPAEQAFYNEARSLPNVTGSKIIQLGNVTELQEDGEITFTIPPLDLQSSFTTVTAKASLIEYENASEYSWTGKIDGGGTMNLISRPGGQGGFIHLQNNDFYSIFRFPNGGGKAMLLKHVDNIDAICASISGNSSSSSDFCDLGDTTCPAVIDILVLFSQDADDLSPFAAVIIGSLMEASTNAALANSGIANKRVRIKFVDDFNFTFNTPLNIRDDVDDLVIAAQPLRNTHRADIVVMLTDRTYLDGLGRQIFGAVEEIGGGNDDAFLIVEVPFLLGPRWTFAHEIGHIIGARHLFDSFGTCEHAFVDAGPTDTLRTILAPYATDISVNPRILHYSNPSVNFGGIATGDPTHDNAQVMRYISCATADFQPSWEWHTFISSDEVLCSQLPFTATAVILEGTTNLPGAPLPPYSFEWFSSTDGINNLTSLPSSTETVTFSWPCPPCEFFFLHSKVTSSNGLVFESVKRIAVESVNCFNNEEVSDRSTSSNISLLNKKANFLAVPNPSSSGFFHLQNNAENKAIFPNISVFSTTGKLIKKYQKVNITDSWQLDLSQQSKGIYFLKITSGRSVETIKLIKS